MLENGISRSNSRLRDIFRYIVFKGCGYLRYIALIINNLFYIAFWENFTSRLSFYILTVSNRRRLYVSKGESYLLDLPSIVDAIELKFESFIIFLYILIFFKTFRVQFDVICHIYTVSCENYKNKSMTHSPTFDTTYKMK